MHSQFKVLTIEEAQQRLDVRGTVCVAAHTEKLASGKEIEHFFLTDRHSSPKGWVPITFSLPQTAVPRPAVPDGIIRNIRDLLSVYYPDRENANHITTDEQLAEVLSR